MDGVTLQIEEAERIGLLGRNGSGKSTFLKLLTGDVLPDKGNIVMNSSIKIALLPQEVPDNLPGSVYDIVASGGSDNLDLLRQYHKITQAMGRTGGPDHPDRINQLKALEDLQHQLEASGAWHFHNQVERIITRTDLDENAEFQTLSAGMKRRVFLAKALVNDPDLLLLDEPTNHLDLNAIIWLEDFLLKYDKTIMFVTHDRAFLQHLAKRIVEIDRGKLISYACDYGTYIERRQAMLDAEESAWDTFDKKLEKEELWIRQGIKARCTRNEGRVRALEEMRRERIARRGLSDKVTLSIEEAKRSGKLVVETQKIRFAYGEKIIVNDFSTTILRGDRVGIIGPNGSGKTTLLKVLLGELEPQDGKVRLGTGIQIAYFDQLRSQLDESKSVKDNVADGNDKVFVGGGTRHIVGYLQDFLFSPDQMMAPVRSLSGGERNRLLLAKLFCMPSNILVLDEPTNDLDAETLELLEERLLDYKGTILMVSHDRTFLNNVVTSTIVFEGEGHLQEYVGGYDDWQRQKTAIPSTKPDAKDNVNKREKPVKDKLKLTFKESRELEELPSIIETMEKEKDTLNDTLSSPEFYAYKNPAEIKAVSFQLESLTKALEEAYLRWDELETLRRTIARNTSS